MTPYGYDTKMLRREFDGTENVMIYLERGEEIVATVELRFPSDNRKIVLLRCLWVHKDHRRRGLARSLMIAAANIAKRPGREYIAWVVNEENTAAIALYESLGAKVLDRQEDEIEMGVAL